MSESLILPYLIWTSLLICMSQIRNNFIIYCELLLVPHVHFYGHPFVPQVPWWSMIQSFWSLFHFSLSLETSLAEAEVCYRESFVCRLSTYMYFMVAHFHVWYLIYIQKCKLLALPLLFLNSNKGKTGSKMIVLLKQNKFRFFLFKWFPKTHAIVHSQNHVPLSCGPAVKWYIIITSVQSIFSLQIV
jgi:hypothetical protein